MLFIADGQHRREGIAMALREDSSIGLEHVPVIFIPYNGTARARQLFSDLNLNAKPVTKTLGLALETRDSIVIASKRVAMDVPFFRHRVNMESNSLSARSPYVISMNTLKTAHGEMLAAMCRVSEKDLARVVSGAADLQRFASQEADMQMLKTIKSIKELRPDDPRVASVSDPLTEFWNFVIPRLPDTAKLLQGKIKNPGELRDGPDPETDPWGGYIFAFGIGWQAIALAAAALIRVDSTNWKTRLETCLDRVDWQKGPHWNGIAMVGTRVNNTGPGIRATAGYILEVGDIRDELGLAKSRDELKAELGELPGPIDEMVRLFEVLDNSRQNAVPPASSGSLAA